MYYILCYYYCDLRIMNLIYACVIYVYKQFIYRISYRKDITLKLLTYMSSLLSAGHFKRYFNISRDSI